MKTRSVVLMAVVALTLVTAGSARGAIPGGPLHHPSITAPACREYGAVGVTGVVTIPGVGEVSGVVASRIVQALWIEEDSGNPTTIYAIDPAGRKLATVQVGGATNRDWEDIALASGRIWLADIGDNSHTRTELQVYWFNEPSLSTTSVSARLLTLRYADGVARNAEALVVDGDSKTLYIFTKESGTSRVFQASIRRLRGGESKVLTQVATLPLNKVTAADLGPKGVIVKSGNGYLYRWTADRQVLSALSTAPCSAPAGPGESLAFSSDDRGLYAIPEGSSPSVYYTPHR
jgi:hypothetical protein